MQGDMHKVNAGHLKRCAYLYIRQSTPRQVLENTESAKRQYALRQRALALGWHPDRIVVIDGDQGQSGSSAADREGFQKLVAEVGMGHAGLVIGLEVSRLARNCSDWHRLLEICGFSDTLILDEDGLYNPADFNDRLLLGLKGTMSEAELHFRRLRSACAVVRAFREANLRFPRRLRGGPQDGELLWQKLDFAETLFVLHNPRYAGAFAYGKTRTRKTLDGVHQTKTAARGMVLSAHWRASRLHHMGRIPGDQAVGELLLEIMTPVTIDITLAVQQELQARLEETDRLRKQPVERARYEAELAQRRYLQVHPDNRLVADSLEADWNRKLCALQEAQQQYERDSEKDRLAVDEELRTRLHMLATDFPRLWRDPNTPDRGRKRLARLLLQDVTLIKKDQILVHIRFPGGMTRTLEVPIPLHPKLTPPSVVAEIDRLLDHPTCQAIADNLNSRGFAPGYGKPFHGSMIARIAKDHGLKTRWERLRERGMLTLDEMGKRLGICTDQVKAWRAAGFLRAHLCNDKDEYLYQDPGPNPPRVGRGAKLLRKGNMNENTSHHASEVQCEA